MQSPPPLSSFPSEGRRRRHSRSDRDRCHQERASRVTPLGSGPDLPRPIACRRATAGRVDAGPAVLAPPPYLSTTADTCAPAEKETTTNCKWRRACLPACFRWRVERGAGERPSSFAGAPGALILCSAPAAEEEQGGDGGGGGAVRHPAVVQGLAQGAGGRHPARQHPARQHPARQHPGVRVLAGLRRGVPADAHVLEPRRAPLPLPPPVDRLQPRRCPPPPKDPHLQGLCGRNHHHVHPRKEGQHQGVLRDGLGHGSCRVRSGAPPPAVRSPTSPSCRTSLFPTPLALAAMLRRCHGGCSSTKLNLNIKSRDGGAEGERDLN